MARNEGSSITTCRMIAKTQYFYAMQLFLTPINYHPRFLTFTKIRMAMAKWIWVLALSQNSEFKSSRDHTYVVLGRVSNLTPHMKTVQYYQHCREPFRHHKANKKPK